MTLGEPPREDEDDPEHGPMAIPAWMLSEGTRRLTAIMALLVRQPAPSLICIEEIENGLDPWTVRQVLGHLQSAVERGIQVILTTHSTCVLDDVAHLKLVHEACIGTSRNDTWCQIDPPRTWLERARCARFLAGRHMPCNSWFT